MGTIAYVRQIYLDAEHYKLVKEAYAKNPRGMQRPEYDRALEGVLESKRILLPANRLVEIDRMLRFAAELKQPAIIYGGRESLPPRSRRAAEEGRTRRCCVSLRWPDAAAATPIPRTRTASARWRPATKRPPRPPCCKKAGVKFALYSDGIEQPRDLQRAVKKAIDAGPDARGCAARPDAVARRNLRRRRPRRAVIEKGKIANLVVTRGDIFDDRTQGGNDLRGRPQVHAGGRRLRPPADAAPATDDPGGNLE